MKTIQGDAAASDYVSQSLEEFDLKRLLLESGVVVMMVVLDERVGYLDQMSGYANWVWLRGDRVAAIRPYAGQPVREGQRVPDFILGQWGTKGLRRFSTHRCQTSRESRSSERIGR